MKKSVLLLALAGTLAALLTACGNGGGDRGGNTTAASPQAAAYDVAESEDMPMEFVADDGISQSAANGSAEEPDSTAYDSSKLILRGSISAEATDFDAAVSAIEQQALKAGGYIENSSVVGSTGYRWGNFTLRVPREQFETTFDAVGDNCHVTERSRSSENVSADYYDAESRKSALEIKRDRLLALLEKADNMEDIIALESALSDVQYEIEQLSGALRGYDRLITFSTIEIYLSEVRDLSVVQQEDSFVSDLKTAAITGTRGLVSFVQGLILAIVYGWWFYLLLAIVLVLLVRRLRRRKKTGAAPQQPPAIPLSSDTETDTDAPGKL